MRRYFIDKLEAWRNKPDRKPLILKGARQVGKTYILQEFGRKSFPNYHYFNFELEENKNLSKIFDESLDPKFIISQLSFKIQKKIDIKNDLVIFDEVQFIPKALSSLKYFCEMMPELRLVSAGSLLGIHLNESSFPVGKVEFLNLFPMSFEEFLLGIGDQQAWEEIQNFDFKKPLPNLIHQHLWKRFKSYLVVGGLPETVKIYSKINSDDDFSVLDKVRENQNNLISSYTADIAKHSGKINAMHIERIWRNIPLQLSQTQDGSASRFIFKDVISGIKSYTKMVGAIDWLISAGLIIKVPIVNHSKQPLLAFSKENIFKLLMFDIGLLGALARIQMPILLNYDFGTYQGFYVENFIAQTLRALDDGVDNFYSWQEGQAEIEFLREYGTEIIPFEVKSGWVTKSKSLTSYINKYHPQTKVILSAKNFSFDSSQNLFRVPLYLVESLNRFLHHPEP